MDEFHERSVEADLALALCLDCQKRLRPDLRYSSFPSLFLVPPYLERYIESHHMDRVSAEVMYTEHAGL